MIKIISDKKDYYDYLSHTYGYQQGKVFNRCSGITEKLYQKYGLEVRNCINTLPDNISKFNECLIKIDIKANKEDPQYSYEKIRHDILFDWLIFCGRLYLITKRQGKYWYQDYLCVIDEEYYNNIFKPWFIISNAKFKKYLPKYKDISGQTEYQSLVDLSIKINMPYFFTRIGHVEDCSNKTNRFTHTCNVLLKDYGVDKILAAEQAYQDISYFVCNILCNNSDMNPPVEVSNACKIEGHGFDKIISFRKRKNE